MKRHFLVPVAAMLAAALILPVAAGCGRTLLSTPYEIATELGTEGDAASWLSDRENTKTAARRMYEEACSDGYSGSYVEFLKEIGAPSDDSAAVNGALMSSVDVYAAFRQANRELFSEEEEYYSMGSGVLYSVDKTKGDAYILTNYHVVYSPASAGNETIKHLSDDVSIMLYGSEYSADRIPVSYVGGSMDYDIAVLKAEGSELIKESGARAITAADSDALTLGERVYAIGNADAKRLSVVSGIVSLDAEYIDVTAADGKKTLSMLEIRTDAPINHGNSGGGLFNADGKLIGVVNARSEKSGVEHFGYAIPANLALAVAQNIIDNSKANGSKGALRATLGVTVTQADGESVYDEKTGKAYLMETVIVSDVTRGSACWGKLEEGDVLYSVRIGEGEEVKITRLHMLGTAMFKVRKNDILTITFSRDGSVQSVQISFTANDFTLFA